jgi:putative endonuclease
VAHQQDIGNQGERLAVEYLQHKGYTILATNWRYKRAEIDIIAQTGSIRVFVEVKARSSSNFGPPDLAVNPKKEALLTSAAHEYLGQLAYEGEIRFDVISILLEQNKMAQIQHIEDAFFCGL